MNVATLLEEQAARTGGRPAIVEPRASITFRELDDAAAAVAAELSAAGVRAGMRALVYCPMSIALYATMVALFRLRATAVFVDPSAGRARLAQCVRRAAPEAFIAVPRAHWLRLTCPEIRAIPIRVALQGHAPGAVPISLRAARGARDVEAAASNTPAILTFTSGSTGEPRAVVRTHGFLVAQHRALVETLRLRAGDIDLATLPIFVLANLASGVTSVIPDADLRAPGAVDPGRVARQIARTRPTRTVASPAFLARLSAHAARSGRPFDSFQRVHTGGAPVFPAMLDAIAYAMPYARVSAVYGSTEAEPIAEIEHSAIGPADRARMRAGAGLLAGPPVGSLSVRVLPDRWSRAMAPIGAEAFEREALGPGLPGEIVVSGEHVVPGYLDGIGDEETKIRVDERVWHRTGDAGYFDARGRLWLLGRCAAKVEDGDGVLYPFAVECAASDVPDVTRTALVLHHGRRVLVVESRGDRAGTQAALAARLEWASIREIRFVRRIPVDGRHNAKVDYPALHRVLGA